MPHTRKAGLFVKKACSVFLCVTVVLHLISHSSTTLFPLLLRYTKVNVAPELEVQPDILDIYTESLFIASNNLTRAEHPLPLRRALSCSSPELLSSGRWIVRHGTPSWWQPSECHMRIYEAFSAMEVLNNSGAVFIGGSRMKSYMDLTHHGILKARGHHIQMCSRKDFAVKAGMLTGCNGYLRKTTMLFLEFGWDDRISQREQTCAHLTRNHTSNGVDECVRRDLAGAGRYIHEMVQYVSSIRGAGYSGEIILLNEEINCSSETRHSNALRRAINHRARHIGSLKQSAVDAGRWTHEQHCLHVPSSVQVVEKPRYPATADFAAAVSQVMLNVLDSDVSANYSAYDCCKSCALVSTAGYLANYEYGNSIDDADLVVRVGAGPTKGFERHVGGRTDLRFVRFSVFDGTRGIPDLSDTRLVAVMHDRVQSMTSVLSKSPQRQLVASKSVPFFNFHIWDFEEQSSTFSKCVLSSGKLRSSAHLSSGSWAFIFLTEGLNICREVKLYGFAAGKFPGEHYHYWSMGLSSENTSAMNVYRSREGWGHPFMDEQRCLETLANQTADHVLSYQLSMSETSR